jgi:broad specificity phosphatase PhoE
VGEGVATIYHSHEIKARETAEIIAEVNGVRTVAVADLRELKFHGGFVPLDEFKRRVGAYLEGANDPDFEPYAEATERIVRCVQGLAAREQGRPFVVVTHGRIIAALYSWLFGRRLTRAEWGSIGFPDLSVVDLSTRKVVRGFLAEAQK